MKPILILLPVSAYGLLTLIFAAKLSLREISKGLVKAHLVIFAFVAITTEALSLIQAISFRGVLAAWLLLLAVCTGIATLLMRRRRPIPSLPVLRGMAPLKLVLVGTIVLVLGITLVTAILYPPNNWDSMTYHMSRVAHWISNNNVSFYPTSISRQNYQMPLAEFAIMHIQMLTGLDLYANLVQWVSFLVLICLAQLSAAELGLSKRQQLLSAVIMTTLPMAILQASSTQNDLVVSSFVVSFGVFMLRMRRCLSAENVLLTSIALGLALLTKGTAYVYCAAIGASLAVSILLEHKTRRDQILRATAALALVVIFALVLNAGHLTRNYKRYGRFLSTESQRYQNEDMSGVSLLANLARNGALHLGTPSRATEYLYRAMQAALGPQLNNPKTTWPGTSFEIPHSRHEDTAGNLFHMLIVLSSALSLPILWLRGRYTTAIWYAIGTMLGAVLYCWVFKWQPWASRLHTPLFALAAPLLAVTITAKSGNVGRVLGHVVVLSMILYSLIFALANQSRFLVSLDWYYRDRIELYFVNREDLFDGYTNAMDVVQQAGVEEVGLYLGGDDWEYPFWAFALQPGADGRAVSFRHVGVTSDSGTVRENTFLPLYIIATRRLDDWQHASNYISVYTSDHVSVFKKSEQSNP